MTTHILKTNIRQMPDLAIIDMQGEINGLTDEILADAYSEAESANPEVVVLNFTKVDYINSTGIALIVGLLAKARQARRRLFAYGLSEHYQEIFTITRLSDFMGIYPDESSALADVPTPA